MMELVVGDSLSRAFRRGVNEEAHRRFLWQHREQQERQRRQREDQFDQAESDMIDLASAIITSDQAEIFQSELDIYQTATVEALEENREAMERARMHLDRIMERAHQLEDGRRVFKSEDGTRVFDEFGAEVSPDIISPDDIPDHLLRWEAAQSAINELERLEREQAQLLEFQSELDEAQEMLDSGEMTQEQFEERRQYLRDHAPDSVKAHAEGIDFEGESKPAATAAEPDIDLDDELADMPTPQPFAPGMGG